ncbi:MAG: hotdog fold thioesterase [Bacteroidetes bacterium]|nr:hotdog fold thioesterase [Bacteroidota bacterium]
MEKFEVKNPAFREAIKEKLRNQHFMHHLGLKLTRIEAGEVEARLAFGKELQQQNGFLHGGVTATLCDVTAGFAAFTLVEEDEVVVTGDLRVSYLNPGTAPSIYSKGWVIKTGKLLHFCESEVWGEFEEGTRILIAKASATMVTIKLTALDRSE